MRKRVRCGAAIPVERIQSRILWIRGHKVMLDADLARMYGVSTFNLNKAVRRNLRRFPDDFLFRLTSEEHESLIFQSGISKKRGRGGRRHAPFAFTEHGVAMLSSVLRSERAIQVNIAIMRAFGRLRETLASHRRQSAKLSELERRVGTHDEAIQAILGAIRRLIEEPTTERIGFRPTGR